MRPYLFQTGSAVMLFLSFQSAAATIHYVDVNGTNSIAPYTNWATAATNIQDALNYSGLGDMILVTNGVYRYGGYYNSGSNRVYAIRNQIIQSVNGPAVTIIKGYQIPGTTNGNNAVRCVYLGPDTTLSGFTLTNGATPEGWYGGGVLCSSTNCIVTNCVIGGNVSYGNGGGVYKGTLINCSLIGNTAGTVPNVGAGGGAYQSTLINCVLAHNFAGYIAGGALSCRLDNCTVANNSAATYSGSLADCTVLNSIVYYNFSYYTNADFGGGVNFTNCCVSFPQAGGLNNFTNPPLFADLTGGDYHLGAASPCINAGNNTFVINDTDLGGNPRIVGGTVDVGAYEVQSLVHYVKAPAFGATPASPFSNWITAATNIQDAIDAADAGDFVVVSNGVYDSGGRVVFGTMTNRVAIDKPVTVESVNGPASTIIVGSRTAYIPPIGIRCVYLTNGAAMIGFTLTNGATQNTGDIFQEQSGGGAWCNDSGVVLSNCIFAGNAAARYGGGAYQGTLFNCVLTNNSAAYGGGAASNALFNCTLVRNLAMFQNLNYGGGAYGCTLSNSLIYGNQSVSGGGYGGGAAFSTLNGCLVSSNIAGNSGGGVFFGTADNSIIFSNRAMAGGGASSNFLNDCLLKYNQALSDGGGAYFSTLGGCTVASNLCVTGDGGGLLGGAATNCVVYYNFANRGGPNYSQGILSFCDTVPLPAGPGNITNEPIFVNLSGGDFHLQSSSPCINTGNNAAVVGDTDLDGNPRIVGGTVDIGAYEFQSPDTVPFYARLQMTTNGPTGVTVSWQSVNRVLYFIQRSGVLSAPSPFSTIQSNIVGQAGTTSYTDTEAVGNGPFFYRVGVQH